MESRKLLDYTIDIIDITEFRKYYDENIDNFSSTAENSFLKALDIPPKFFKEQPEETRKELLDNREIFVREAKKFFDKVIVVVKRVNEERNSVAILNACRMGRIEAIAKYEALKPIEDFTSIFEHRSFIKDGYISLIYSEEKLDKNEVNSVLAIDFPILLNKKPILHHAFFELANENSDVPVDHLSYGKEVEVDLDTDYNNIKEAIEDRLDFLTSEELEDKSDEYVLAEADFVALALQELGTIPKTLKDKVARYLEKRDGSSLTKAELESKVLDFDQTLNSYKQVNSLRKVSADKVVEVLNSEGFKEIAEALREELEVLV